MAAKDHGGSALSVAVITSRAQLGTEAPPVTIEVFLSGGLPSFSIVGMPETAVRESKDRVRSALISSGFRFPQERITVSLAPADMRKAGGRFDLAVALGILVASRQLPGHALGGVEVYGELALTGALRSVPAILPAALAARDAGAALLVPEGNAREAALSGATVYGADSLLQVTAHLGGSERIAARAWEAPVPDTAVYPDIADVKGQEQAKRALEIAAAGGHNLLMIGPPGTGKSMLASRLPGILPSMTVAEALERAAIESVLGRPVGERDWLTRPFRAPHHTASAAALVGGGAGPRPGEISRAHNGVLFLDELPEFNRNVLEVLREPLESGRIAIARAGVQAEFPARFQLIAAMNPCPCGFLGDPKASCTCSGERVAAYRSKISGPLLDRIDLHVEVCRLDIATLRAPAGEGETSVEMRGRIELARALQLERAGTCNAQLDTAAVEHLCLPGRGGRRLLERAAEHFSLSARAYQRVLRVARTIADLAGVDRVSRAHVGEALTLRTLDKRQAAGRLYCDSATM